MIARPSGDMDSARSLHSWDAFWQGENSELHLEGRARASKSLAVPLPRLIRIQTFNFRDAV